MEPDSDALRRSASSLTVHEVNNDEAIRAQSHLIGGAHQSPSRPQMTRRAITEHDLSSRTLRPNWGKRQGGEREWSVFGQLMEDSGQLKTPDSTRRIKKRQSQRSMLPNALSTSTMPSRPDSILEEGGSVFQSPIQGTFPELRRPTSSQSDYDSDHESGSDSEAESSSSNIPPPRRLIPEIPVLYRNIIKCAVAYFLGSLFTYVTPLSHMIGSITSDGDRVPSPSGHMVATV